MHALPPTPKTAACGGRPRCAPTPRSARSTASAPTSCAPTAQPFALAPDFQVADTERCIALRTTALEHTLERAYARMDADAGFRLLADTVGNGRDDARLGELVLTLYDKMQCHARPEQWAAQQVELLALDGVTDAGATPWGRSLLARVRESAAHWAGVLDEQLNIMAAHDMEWLYGIYGTSFGSTAAGLRAVVRACDQSWDTAVAALQDVPFPRLGSTRKPPDPDVRDRVKAQRDAAKKAIQTLQKQINIPSAQALADLHTTAPAMQALLALTLDFGTAYAAEKRRRSLVDFSDLEHMTAQLLTDEDGAPTELARQLSGRYTEIMVDEYQDVSEVQDLIFRAVSREGNNLFFRRRRQAVDLPLPSRRPHDLPRQIRALCRLPRRPARSAAAHPPAGEFPLPPRGTGSGQPRLFQHHVARARRAGL